MVLQSDTARHKFIVPYNTKCLKTNFWKSLSFNFPCVSCTDAIIASLANCCTMYNIFLRNLHFRSGFDSIYLYYRMRINPSHVDRFEMPRRVLMTLLWFISTLFLAVVVPQIGAVIKVLGALAAVFIFIFPGKSTDHFLPFIHGSIDTLPSNTLVLSINNYINSYHMKTVPQVCAFQMFMIFPFS